MRYPLYRLVRLLLGALFVWAGIYKLLHPGPATMALESLDVSTGRAKGVVAGVTALELYLGTIIILRFDLKYALRLATGVVFGFTAYLFYLTTLAHPPSCGCLGLTGIFENSRYEALLGLARNCTLLWVIKWTYDRQFPSPESLCGVRTAAAMRHNPIPSQ